MVECKESSNEVFSLVLAGSSPVSHTNLLLAYAAKFFLTSCSILRILCPNCHQQTETWGRKNIGDVAQLGRGPSFRSSKVSVRIRSSLPLLECIKCGKERRSNEVDNNFNGSVAKVGLQSAFNRKNAGSIPVASTMYDRRLPR